MSEDYTISIEDDGRKVRLQIEFPFVGSAYVVGPPALMRKLRDELTRAIVCAEVMAEQAEKEK